MGFIFYLVVPARFQASVVITPARVGSIVAGGFIQGSEPEPAGLMIERLKQPTFFTLEIAKACQIDGNPNFQNEMAKNLTKSIVKLPTPSLQNLSLLKLSWSDSSAQLAENCLGAIVQGVAQAQNRITAPIVEKITQQTKLTQNEVDLYMAELHKLAGKDTSKEAQQSNFNQIVIADKAAQNLRESLLIARKQLTEYQAMLTPPYTQGVTELEPIYASYEPVLTAKLAILTGGLAGLFIGIFALLARRGIRVYRSEIAG